MSRYVAYYGVGQTEGSSGGDATDASRPGGEEKEESAGERSLWEEILIGSAVAAASAIVSGVVTYALLSRGDS